MRLLRELIQAIWPHLTPPGKEALVAWARRDLPEHPVIDEIVGAVLDCNLDEDPAFQQMLSDRIEEATRGANVSQALTLTETESYLLCRLGDAWVELARGRTDLVRAELAEGQKAADQVTASAAELRAENERLRGALRGIAEARNWCGTEHDTTIYWRFADMAEQALAGAESDKGQA